MTPHSNSQNTSIDRRRALAVGLLARGATLREVREELCITRDTLFRWRREPGFILGLHAATQARALAGFDYMDGLVSEALVVLGNITRDAGTPPVLRALAANAILEAARVPTEPPRGRGQIARSSISSFTALCSGLIKQARKAAP
jgi:hypothetical protein